MAANSRVKLNLHLVILISTISTPFVSPEPGYLKFCGEEHKHIVHSTSCTKGLWLNGPMKPGCVCVKGVWALSGGLCDKRSAIIVGEDHCFHVGFDVRAVKFIGNPNDPFAPSLHVAPADFNKLHEIPESGFTPEVDSDPSVLIGINPRQVAQRGDKSICIELNENFKNKPVHIYGNPVRSPSSKWALGDKAQCKNTKDFTFHLGFGEMFQDNKIYSKDFIGRECLDQCPASNIPLPDSVKARAFSQNPNNKGRSAHRGSNSSRQTVSVKTEDELIKEAMEERAKVTIDLDDYHQELNEQTLRMMHAQINPILLNLKSDSVDSYTKEYRYFQKAREVVVKICPEEYVPSNLVMGLMRMFKRLLWESLDERPHTQSGNDEQFDRIMKQLENCTTESALDKQRYSFKNYSGSFNYSSRSEPDKLLPEYPKPEQCPEPLIYAVAGVPWTEKSENKETNLQNATGNFKPGMKFNVDLVDFVIETAWKIVTIGHYYCTRSFEDSTSGDFSSFFHQMELFFNDKIVKRWYDPMSVANTYKILQLIFPTYDLKKFAFGIDLCMVGSQQFSQGFDFNSKWIQRPKIPYTPNDLVQAKYDIPGGGSPLSTNDYAPKIESRPKRDTTMWNGKAECMEEFSDPVKLFGYAPKAGCRL